MTYNKPSGITYTEMAIWIDANAYEASCDDAMLYEYLYHLSNMLAHEGNYFNRVHYYDDFSLYCASKLFMRLRNKKQDLPEDNPNKLPQIKSILNYMKKLMYPMKVDFEQENYCQSDEENGTLYVSNFDLGQYLSDEATIFNQMEFSYTLSSVSMIVKSHLQKIPYKKDSPEWLNIYVSCMLTLLNSITLSNFNKARASKLRRNSEQIIDKLYVQLRYEDPILYHLDSSMSNYIKVLVNELRKVISSQLSFELHTATSSEDTTKNLIIASLDEES